MFSHILGFQEYVLQILFIRLCMLILNIYFNTFTQPLLLSNYIKTSLHLYIFKFNKRKLCKMLQIYFNTK